MDQIRCLFFFSVYILDMSKLDGKDQTLLKMIGGSQQAQE